MSDHRTLTATDAAADRVASAMPCIGLDVADITAGLPMVRGRFGLTEIRPGLSLHYTALEELGDFAAETELDAALTVSLVLEGQVDARLDDLRISHGEGFGKGSSAVAGGIWSLTRPARLRRHARMNARQKKIMISVDRAWLDRSVTEGAEAEAILAFADRHLMQRAWPPSPRAIHLAERMIDIVETSCSLQRLCLESHGIKFLADAIRRIDETGAASRTPSIRQHRQMIAIRDLIDQDPAAVASLGDLARQAGMSVSTLQQAFRAATGMTVIANIRMRRLDHARELMTREGLTITQAAFVAGYSTAANFTTAFKRTFGAPPSGLS